MITHGVLNSGYKIDVTYYGEMTIEPFLTPEFDVDHDFEVKNGSFQSLFPGVMEALRRPQIRAHILEKDWLVD